jgi:hypothetical protein
MSRNAIGPGDQIEGHIEAVSGQAAVGKGIIQIGTLVLQTQRTTPRELQVHIPPAAQHPLFGRDAEITTITAAVKERRAVLVRGLGGMGKSALAGKVTQQLHAKAFFPQGILWVRARLTLSRCRTMSARRQRISSTQEVFHAVPWPRCSTRFVRPPRLHL